MCTPAARLGESAQNSIVLSDDSSGKESFGAFLEECHVQHSAIQSQRWYSNLMVFLTF